MDKLLSQLQLEDLPEDLREIADVIGLDAMRRLIDRFRGERIYIPFPSRIDTLVVRYIRQNYACGDDGSNVRELARETGMRPEYVRQVLRRDQDGPRTSE